MRVLVVAALLALPHPAAADEPACIVRGTQVTLQDVVVTPAGHAAFPVDLHQRTVAAHLPRRCGAATPLQVGGPLELAGTRTDLWLRLTRDVTSSDGMIVAARGAAVIDACVRGDRVIATAVLDANDVLEGEHKRPDQLVRGLDIPCDALTLDLVDGGDEPFPDENAQYWELRGSATRIVLRKEPRAKAAGHLVEAPTCTGCIALRQLARRGAWVQVAVEGMHVSARGWVRVAALKRLSDPPIRGGMCTGDHGSGFFGTAMSPQSVVREGTVRRDTVVYAEPASGSWGRFAATTRVRVLVTQGSAWAQLLHVPGVSGPGGQPWLDGVVPLDALTLDPLPAP